MFLGYIILVYVSWWKKTKPNLNKFSEMVSKINKFILYIEEKQAQTDCADGNLKFPDIIM